VQMRLFKGNREFEVEKGAEKKLLELGQSERPGVGLDTRVWGFRLGRHGSGRRGSKCRQQKLRS
jgi:hypothetical protein